MNKSLKTIAVDLTPVLPGGENGGAKIFVLELLARLAEMHTNTQFILLTQASSHEELAALDRLNMSRIMVLAPVVTNTIRPRLQRLVARLLPHLPGRLRRIVSRLAYGLNSRLKRSGSSSLLRNMSVDLLFCPFTAPTYFELGVPTVCTIYDLQYKTFPEFFAAEDVAHRDSVFVEACRKASALVAISNYSRDSAISHGGLDPARIRTIHLRMAQRIVPKSQQDVSVLDRLNLARHKYFMYPANFWKHKNHEMLLTAFGMACHAGLARDIKLVCTGAPGERQEWLQKAAYVMNLGERIVFPGYLPSAELAALMGNCVGLVFPSLYEGFGLPVIEAMAAGVPVASGNRTSLPEVAADAAILFDPRVPNQISQAMISLVDNLELRERLIHAGLHRSDEFSDSARMASEYWELFEFAFGVDIIQSQLDGIYQDGWAGPNLNIQIAPNANAKQLEIEFIAPHHQDVSIQPYFGGKIIQQSLEIPAGKDAVFSMPLDKLGGNYEIRISPVFVPALEDGGVDQRQLAAKVRRCSISQVGDGYIPLYPAQEPV